MILLYLSNAALTILEGAILFFIGDFLSRPTALRAFFGIGTSNENTHAFQQQLSTLSTISLLVRLMGILMAVGAIARLVYKLI